MKKELKNIKGITLIALVITIIVLLILAGVSIAMLTGDNGILNQTTNAKIQSCHATVKEAIALAYGEYQVEINTSKVTEEVAIASMQTVAIPAKEEKSLSSTSISFWDYLLGKNYIDENGIVNVVNLVGSKQFLGNGLEKGTENEDVYKIEEGVLYYYNEKREQTKIYEIYIPEPTEPTAEEYFDFDPETGTISLKGAKAYTEMGNDEFPITEVVVPSTYKGKKVKEIGDFTYKNIEKVVISEGVTRISSSAFGRVEKLKVVEIPDSVNYIGSWVFSGCSNLSSITIPDGVTRIESFVFLECSSLTSIKIPSSVTSIEGHAFSGCSGLTSIEIPSGVTKIDYRTFSGCSGLTSIEIPSSVTSIDSYAFSGCSGLTSIEIPSSVTSIDPYAFSGCSGLTSIEIPSGVTIICGEAFSGCSGLTSIEIPSSVTWIGNNAFSGCSGLMSINIPSGVTEINGSTFEGCSGLTSIEIPSSVTEIGNLAFSGCSGLTTVTYKGTKEQWSNIRIVSGNEELLNAQIVCTDGTIEPGE